MTNFYENKVHYLKRKLKFTRLAHRSVKRTHLTGCVGHLHMLKTLAVSVPTMASNVWLDFIDESGNVRKAS